MGNQINENFVRTVAEGVVNEFSEYNRLHGDADIVYYGPGNITAYVQYIPDDSENVMLEVCLNGRCGKVESVQVAYDKDGNRGVFVPMINRVVLFDEFTACDDECGIDITESNVKEMIKETVERVQRKMNEGLMSMRKDASNEDIAFDASCFDVLKLFSELRAFPGLQISLQFRNRKITDPYTIAEREIFTSVNDTREREYEERDGHIVPETLFGFIQYLRKIHFGNGLGAILKDKNNNATVSDYVFAIGGLNEAEMKEFINANVGFKRTGILSRFNGDTTCLISLDNLIKNLSAVHNLFFT